MSEITERPKIAIASRYLIERELGQGGMAATAERRTGGRDSDG